MNERRIPLGSSSKLLPENVISANLDFTASTESPDSNSRPPSIALSSSCVIVGLEDEADAVPAYASHLPSHSDTKSA